MRDITDALLSEVCHGVSVEPCLQPLSGEMMSLYSANTDNNSRSALRPRPAPGRGVVRVGGHRKVAIQPELNCSFSLQAVAVRKTPPTLPKEL